MIDTGAASTVLNLALARRLGLEVVPLGQSGDGARADNLKVFAVQGADLRLGEVVPRPDALRAMDLSGSAALLPGDGVSHPAAGE